MQATADPLPIAYRRPADIAPDRLASAIGRRR
jgi:hypothetical protein